ncbi:MAG: hypothetical protein D6754_13415 [Alphaproteobacteria bacterium]|nr:MAG: hypothetical protein D6754_13415 [Alphaproteobacteria bacterium]
MKLILYIGHHKVGSTALQGYLARNALALLEHGILYPAVESEGLIHLLALATKRQAQPMLDRMNVREPHNALAFRMLAKSTGRETPPWHGVLPGLPIMLRTIRHQIELLQPQTVILCSEVFSNFGAGHEPMIEKLRDMFSESGTELYCALRRPDEYLVSWYGQRLRFGYKMVPLAEGRALKDTETIHFDYRMLLAPWLQVFDGAKLHLRNYSDILAAGGSVEDFTARVGCDFPPSLSAKGPANRGFPRAAFEILRQANAELDPVEARRLREFFLDLPPELSPIPDRDVEPFGADLRAELFARFAPIHDYLSRLSGEGDFFPDLEEMLAPRPVPLAEASAELLRQLDPHTMPTPTTSVFISRIKAALA